MAPRTGKATTINAEKRKVDDSDVNAEQLGQPDLKRPKPDELSNSPSSSATVASEGGTGPTTVTSGLENSPSLSVLPRVPLLTYDGYNNELTAVSAVNFNSAFDKKTTARLRVIELMSNFGDSITLALASPDTLYMNNGYVCLQGSRKPTLFSAVGSCRFSSLFSGNNARQVCLNISDKTLPRAIAVLGLVTGEKQLYAGCYKGGLTFSTYKKGNRTNVPTAAKGRGIVDISSSSGKASTSFRPVLPWDEDVPAYDGTLSFNPKNYRNLKALNSFEIQPDSAILVTFTVGTFPYTSVANAISTEGLNTSLSLNIQSVINLANPSDDKDIKDKAPETPIGVEQEAVEAMHEKDNGDITSDDVFV